MFGFWKKNRQIIIHSSNSCKTLTNKINASNDDYMNYLLHIKQISNIANSDISVATVLEYRIRDLLERLPTEGPLDIADLDRFLAQAKQDFEHVYKNYSLVDERLNIQGFTTVKLLGKGTFGRVILVKRNVDNSVHAIKCVSKKLVLDRHCLKYVHDEKRIMQGLNFPFVVYLKFFFIDSKYIYMGMPYVPGGNLHEFTAGRLPLKENDAKFYVNQIVLAIQYLHHLHVMHRDIKPENILVDATGYIKLADFGQCTHQCMTGKRWTITGTPEYVSPEVIRGRGYDLTIDWWSCGVITYELCAGHRPFRGTNVDDIFRNVVNRKYDFPSSFSCSLKTFVQFLFSTPIPFWKKGRTVAESVKRQRWLRSTDWLTLLNRQLKAPFVPKIEDNNLQ